MEDVRFGLQIDDQIGSGDGRGKHVEVALVEFQLFVVEIDVGENFVFLEEKITDDGDGAVVEMTFEQAAMTFV